MKKIIFTLAVVVAMLPAGVFANIASRIVAAQDMLYNNHRLIERLYGNSADCRTAVNQIGKKAMQGDSCTAMNAYRKALTDLHRLEGLRHREIINGDEKREEWITLLGLITKNVEYINTEVRK